jgi:hypothetical protein
MTDNSNEGKKGQDSGVILGLDVFRRLKKQNEARARARRYLENVRRRSLERQLVKRILNRDRQRPDLHIVK